MSRLIELADEIERQAMESLNGDGATYAYQGKLHPDTTRIRGLVEKLELAERLRTLSQGGKK